jgi:rod shape-determining protein MreB
MTARRFSAYSSSELAIDLGTANTRVFQRNTGMVVNKPSIVAMRKDCRGLDAVGAEARGMLSRTPEQITLSSP